MLYAIQEDRPKGKVHLLRPTGAYPFCSSTPGRRYVPFPGKPKDSDICGACRNLAEGYKWKEPRLSKLLGEA